MEPRGVSLWCKHCLVPPSCRKTRASGGWGGVGLTWDSREPGPVPDTHSVPCMCHEWVVPPDSCHRPSLFSLWCHQAKAILHAKETQWMWLVAGRTPALVESTEQCAVAPSWWALLSASPSATHFCIPSGWAALAQDAFVFRVSFLTGSKSKRLLPEVRWALRASSPSIYNRRRCQAVPKRVLGQSSECSSPTGRGLCTTAPREVGMGKGFEGCRWWGCQGDRLWVVVFFVLQISWGCFFSLKSPGRKWGQEEWQTDAAPVGKASYLGVHGWASKGDEFWSLWN